MRRYKENSLVYLQAWSMQEEDVEFLNVFCLRRWFLEDVFFIRLPTKFQKSAMEICFLISQIEKYLTNYIIFYYSDIINVKWKAS